MLRTMRVRLARGFAVALWVRSASPADVRVKFS